MRHFYPILIIALLLSSRAIAFPIETSPERVAELSRTPEWLALLHFKGNKSLIQDQSFFLEEEGGLNPENELLADIIVFQDKRKEIATKQCQFPARVNWIKHNLPREGLKFTEVRCPELDEYMRSVPLSQVSLVFAAEDISSPTSMMGHLFLKLKGEKNHKDFSHSLSFFANLNNTKNTISFITGALFTGTSGVYQLQPYEERRDEYTNKEHRNIWEYQLNLSKEEMERLKLHIWEMRGVNIAYDLQDNNCATSIIRLLLAADSKMARVLYRPFMAPADVLRVLNEKGMLSNKKFIPSDKYKQGYAESPEDVARKGNIFLKKPHSMRLETDYMFGTGPDAFRLRLSPAYNDLMDISDYTQQDYSVQLFNIEALVATDMKKAHLGRFEILSVQSYVPAQVFGKEYSKSFKIGLENSGFGLGERTVYPRVFAGVGKTFALLNASIKPFAFIRAGYSYYHSSSVLSAIPEVGAILDEGEIGKTLVGASKSINTARYKYDQMLRFSQAFYLTRDTNLTLGCQITKDGNHRHWNVCSIGLAKHF